MHFDTSLFTEIWNSLVKKQKKTKRNKKNDVIKIIYHECCLNIILDWLCFCASVLTLLLPRKSFVDMNAKQMPKVMMLKKRTTTA